MSAPGFVHLQVSSAFSAHYGVSWPAELAEAAAADGQPMLACTDRDGLYGMAKHVAACLEHGIAPIVGVDLAVRRHDGMGGGRVVVLARGHSHGSGYAALCRLVSEAHTPNPGGGAPAVTCAQLARAAAPAVPHAADPRRPQSPELFVLLGPDSDVGELLSRRRYGPALALLRRWRAVLPAGSLHVNVVSHLSAPGERLNTGHAVKALRAAHDARVPAVLTNAVRYAAEDGAATADVLDAARALSSLDDLAHPQPTGQGWLKTSAQMHRLAQEIADAADAAPGTLLASTHALAEACALDPSADLGWGRPTVPETSVLGISADPGRELRERVLAGLAERYPRLRTGTGFTATRAGRELEERMEHELQIIDHLGFAGYFLTVAEAVTLIESLGVRVAARGSGASSLVNHALRISAVDPMAHGLIMERFLSTRRSTLPDIDIDVESARRHEVYRALFDRFGAERTALMSMQNAYRARGAVRDAGLALGMPGADVDAVATQLWRFSASRFREALGTMPELQGLARRLDADRRAGSRQLDLLVDLTERLDRLPRHISMHPCGVILSDAALLRRTPVQPSGMGLPMSQFDKHDMDPMGLLKLDVLGVRMQSAIAYTLQEVERTTGKRVDLEQVPLDDEDTYAMIRTTHTLGCFQIESPGQRELLGKLAPERFEDLIVDISLFRPGPMQSDMVRPFLEHRHGWAPAHYPHPRLRPVLAETHGVTVFHEQVLRTLDTMTGCGLDRADELRRRLGSDAEPEVEALFRAAAQENGYAPDVVDEVWATLHAFGSFGFCKAHGAAFALPTYHSAWLKTHHPAAFMAAILEHDPGMYPARLMVAEARRMSVPVLPVDVNRSGLAARVEWVPEHPEAGPGRWGVRLPLRTVAGLSEAEADRLAAGAPYAALADVRDRARPTVRSLERLARLGALDCLLPAGGASRTDLVHHLELRRPGPRPRQADGQLALPIPDVELTRLTPMFPDPSPHEAVRTELELTALDVTAHLMDSHAPYLDGIGVTRAKDLLSVRSRSRVLVAGVRVATQTPPMRSGRRVVFLSVDDGTGCVDVAFFTEAQHASGELLFSGRLLLIEGTVRRTGDRAVSVQAVRAWDLQRPETLPDPDYLEDTRAAWRAWLEADRAAARARSRGEPVPAVPEIPHHGTGRRPVTAGRAGMAPGTGGAGRSDLPAIPVPHPETWEPMPVAHPTPATGPGRAERLA